MLKKSNLAITIAAFSVVISALALGLAFMGYRESKAIVFNWEVSPRSDISVRLKQEQLINEEGNLILKFSIPIWIECRITNTGARTFSIDSIWVFLFTSPGSTYRKAIYNLDRRLFKPNFPHGMLPKEKIPLPVIVEPGHSKVLLTKIDFDMPRRLYNAYKNEFKEQDFTLGDIYRLHNTDLRISRFCTILVEVSIAGGSRKITRLDIDGDIEFDFTGSKTSDLLLPKESHP